MHLYAIAAGLPRLSTRALGTALMQIGGEFGLGAETRWEASSRSGTISVAGVHHPLARCGPRRYVSSDADGVTWFDGLPVSSIPGVPGYDAAALGARWNSAAGSLDGQFSAAHLNLDAESVELRLDALAMVPVYYAHQDGGVLVSNSVRLIASLLALDSPDPLGVSSFLGLGWAASDRVLTQGIRLLAGGSSHLIDRHGTIQTSREFGPSTILGSTAERRGTSDLAEHLTELTRRAVHDIDPVGCAITAGRDSRLLMALLLAAGEDALYFTGGQPESIDVIVAREIVRLVGVEHEVVTRDPSSSSLDWTEAAARFVRQTDGLSCLLQLHDYQDARDAVSPLGVKLGGVGGEIGRPGVGPLTAIATNVPILRRSPALQRKLLSMKVRNDSGLMTADTIREVNRYLDRFTDARLEEGWPAAQLQEVFYTFERVGRWGATGTRRVSATDDGFSPLCLRSFIEYCFSMKASERYVEAPHHRLLAELSPTLLHHRYDLPFPTPRPWMAPILATRQLFTAARSRRQTTHTPPPTAREEAPSPEYPFAHTWFEERLELMRELFSPPDSELWAYVSRPRIEALLKGSEADRARHQESLLRAATLFWQFHGQEIASHEECSFTAGASRLRQPQPGRA